ncbi:insulinase family protein [Candidatus Parcubacteria bacterium]|nr:insulinase family protein [Candidatus Parcubacteria bacterium]
MFKKIILKNGLRLILAPIKNTEITTVLVMIGTGSRYESKKLNGISHFLEHIFFKGTKKRPTALSISTEMDRIGAEFNAFTGKDETGFYVKADAAHFSLSLDVISDILLNSKFLPAEINREKGVILEEMKMVQDTPMHYVGDLFEKLLYKSDPLGNLIIGTKENILNFKKIDFTDYFNKHYTAENTVVCVAGKISGIENCAKIIEKHFKKIKNGKKQKIESANIEQAKPNILLHYKKTDQAHFCLGARGYGLRDKRRWALKLLSSILGGNMSSRIFIEVRERRGLAYYVRTSYQGYADCGYCATQAGVDKNKIEQAIKIILSEYKKIAEKGIKKDELQKAKDYIKGASAINLETSDQIASFLTNQEILLNKILSPKEHFAKIDRITASDIQETARDIFTNQKLNLTIIGEYKDEKKFERILKL